MNLTSVCDFEKQIGIETFLTSGIKGLDGELRSTPEDFIVSEIPIFIPEKQKGRFLIATVEATNWETNILVRELSNRLHISRKRISFAGTKDKRAKTSQRMAFYKVKKEDLRNIKIKDVAIKDVFYSDHPIRIGDLSGNNFKVIVRNINPEVKLDHVNHIYSNLAEVGGFPNFYGVQRFGVIRPISHIVGKYIIMDDFEKAVLSYIANPIKGEKSESFEARKRLEEEKDFKKALKYFPPYLNFERTMINYLAGNPTDFIGALKELPRNLLTMFVFAYQSYLFNRILSERLGKNLPLNSSVEGDLVIPIRKNIIDVNNPIPVEESNIDKVNIQLAKGNALVGGLLFGYDSVFSKGEMGEIEHKVIDEENILAKDFIIPDIPFLSSSGSRRSLLARTRNLDFKLFDDHKNENKKALQLNFQLDKGCYATCLLREFMKSKDVSKY